MNQEYKNPFDFEEEPIPQETSDISQEIGADVEAILNNEDAFDAELDAIVSAVEDSTGKFGTGLDAIMADAGDPSLEIGADVEAIMAEACDPGPEISADVEAVIVEDAPNPFAEPASMEEPTAQESVPADSFTLVGEDVPVSAECTSFFHIPNAETVEEIPEEVPAATENPETAETANVESTGFFHIPAEEVPADGETTPEEEAPGEQIPVADGATQVIDTEDPLYHGLLNDPEVGAEIIADENAVYAAGLIHHSDAELEQLIADAKAASDPGTHDIVPKEPVTAGDTGVFTVDTGDMVIQDYVDPAHPIAESAKEEAAPEKPLPKRRPKMKRNYGLFGLPHVAATLIWLAITVAIGVSLGRMIWVCAAEVLAFGKPDQEFTVTINAGDNIDIVANKLKNAGLIKYPELFKLYAGITDAEADLAAGTFVLNTKYDYNALVKAMTYHSTARETVKVLIPEGYTCAQIFALLEEKGVCTAAELEEYAANGDIRDRWFLAGIQRGDKYCLEGYLFPDSYEFYTNDEPGRVLGKFLDNFDARFTTIMKEKIDPLNERLAKTLADRGYTQDYIDAHKITIREIIIIASMIERETANDAESYDISSVIYNRLTNPGNFPYLNIDATIIYALGGNIDPVTGKTKPLTKADLELDSPYNTYTNPGLIPGPISNPGRNSLNAALDPSVTSYYFYVYNPNISKHLFAKTAAEHNKNVEYVRSLEENQ